MVKRFFAALVIVSMMAFGASADMVYSNGTNLIRVRSDGTEESTGINVSNSEVLEFNLNGRSMILIAPWSYIVSEPYVISIYDLNNLSTPAAQGDISSAGMTVDSVAVFDGNLILAGGARNSKIVAVNPSTCEIADTYTLHMNSGTTNLWSAVLNWKGTLIAAFEVDSEEGEVVAMDRFGNITGRLTEGYDGETLEVSGGELYMAVGTHHVNSSVASAWGVYRISEVIGTGNMDFSNAVRVAQGNVDTMTRDGKGGLYYSVYGTDTFTDEDDEGYVLPRYIYHWDGTNAVQVYDAGTEKAIDDMYYDINGGILYADIYSTTEYSDGNGFSTYRDYLKLSTTAFVPDSSGRLSVSKEYPPSEQFIVVGNPPESSSSSGNSENISTLSEDSPASQDVPLMTLTIEPAIPSEDVKTNLAELANLDPNVNITPQDIKYITQDNLSEAQEPTQTMREYMQNENYEPVAKFDTVTVSEDGYYVMVVNIPAEFVGRSIDEVRMYAIRAAASGDASAKSSFISLLNGILNYVELTTLTGKKTNSLLGQMLAVGFLQGSQPFSMFLAKAILAVLTGGAGACAISGTGITALLVLGLIFRRRSR